CGYGGAERSAVGEAAVGLDGERYRDRQADRVAGAGDADRFADVGQRVGGGEIRAGPAERLELGRVVSLRVVRIRCGVGAVAVATGADRAADEDVVAGVPAAQRV